MEQMLIVPAAYSCGPEFLLMHGNARAYVAAITMDALQRLEIQVMEWTAASPDLNHINPVWDMLDRRNRGRPVAPHTLKNSNMLSH